MPKYLPLTDVNTKNVYKWTKQNDDGSESSVLLKKNEWKPVNNWTEEEISALFKSPDPVIEETIIEEPEIANTQVVEATPEKKPKRSFKIPF
jgi:hypothetical protein